MAAILLSRQSCLCRGVKSTTTKTFLRSQTEMKSEARHVFCHRSPPTALSLALIFGNDIRDARLSRSGISGRPMISSTVNKKLEGAKTRRQEGGRWTVDGARRIHQSTCTKYLAATADSEHVALNKILSACFFGFLFSPLQSSFALISLFTHASTDIDVRLWLC